MIARFGGPFVRDSTENDTNKGDTCPLYGVSDVHGFPETDLFMLHNSVLLSHHPASQYSELSRLRLARARFIRERHMLLTSILQAGSRYVLL